MNKPILISIIIPIYNMEKFLVRCLDSVIEQTYPHLDIILVNDGSKDGSAIICDQYATQDIRIQVVHKENGGVSDARNWGLDKAKGDYISFVDPDDWVEKTCYEVLIQKLSESDADIIRYNAYRYNGEILNELHLRGEYSGKQLQEEVQLPMVGATKFGGMFILGVLWIHLYRRELIEENGIRFNKNLRRCEDRLFTVTSYFNAQNILFIENPLYHYKLNEGSLSNRYDPIRWEQELLYLSQLRLEYSKLSSEFKAKADIRIKSDCILRAIMSINNEFFSDNDNRFYFQYKRVQLILNNTLVRQSIHQLETEKLGWKGDLILFMIRNRLSLTLSLFETVILYGGKLKNKIKK